MEKIIKILKMIKFEHSVFALPFALMSAFLVEKKTPEPNKLLWILIAMIAARSAAMAFNRLTDYQLDKLNPRTSNRALPKGELSIKFVISFIIISSIIFMLSAYSLNMLCFYLSPLALLIIFSYSYSKRYTYLTHFHLGISLSIAPIGAWLAIAETLNIIPILIAMSVVLWVAGFDILYAIQDIEFDKKYNLKSIPEKVGIKNSLIISTICHAAMLMLLILLYYIANMGLYFIIGIILTTLFIAWQHSIVTVNNLSKINEAFFTANGLLSISLLIFTIFDILTNR